MRVEPLVGAVREVREARREVLVTVTTTLSRTVTVPACETPDDEIDYAICEVDAPEADGWECTGEYDGEVVEP